MNHLVILAPNWLGDAVMALPAIADVRRHSPHAAVTVAAKAAIAPLFQIVSDVDDVIDPSRLDDRFDTALLLPNSFRSAMRAMTARIPERWGYAAEWRALLLTRAVGRPRGVHQSEYYQYLVHALGFPNGPPEPALAIPSAVRDSGTLALREAGWDGTSPIVALAPGAAYGGAKRWPPEYFAELTRMFADDGIGSVLIGSPADAATAREVTRAIASPVLSLVGRTDLPTLAGVLASCRALVSNDSGAMHLAAAIGTPVVAVFGPTDDRATSPRGERHRVLTNPVWCRPCMLRECPLDHRCMRGVLPQEVAAAARTIA